MKKTIEPKAAPKSPPKKDFWGDEKVLAAIQRVQNVLNEFKADKPFVQRTLDRLEARQRIMVEALREILAAVGSQSDPTKIAELTKKLNDSAATLENAVEANQPVHST